MAITVAVVGASGYTGVEAVKILARHPRVRLVAAASQTYAGKPLSALMGGGAPDMEFCAPEGSAVAGSDAIFSCLPHGASAEKVAAWRSAGKTVFDLSADFRLKDAAAYEEWYKHKHSAPALLKDAVYGLPEAHGKEIASANLVAVPGCYPTSVILGLLPLAKAGVVKDRIMVSAVSGVSGAGRKAETEYSFCEVNETLHAYGVPGHRHTPEMEQELSLAAGAAITACFVPHLGPFNRGIHATIFAEPARPVAREELEKLYAAFYAAAPFVTVTAQNPRLKDVRGTNHCHLRPALDARTGRIIVMSVIDNLIKGAAGQAVQCFNIRHGFAETEGLNAAPV